MRGPSRYRFPAFVPLLDDAVAVPRLEKSNQFLRFDQTFERTLGMIEPRVETADGDLL